MNINNNDNDNGPITMLNNINKKSNKPKYIKNNCLIGVHRRFNDKMFNKYDIPARNKIKEQLGNFVKDNRNIYGQDLIINSPTCKYKYLEIQVCINWINTDDIYPYKNVCIYERKAHYGSDTLFLTLNKNMTSGYLFDHDSFATSKPRRLKKYSREYVYDIPWNKVMKVYTQYLDKETIESY
jgi:hypothetical protein